jgi:hypothetical protein
MRLPALHPLQRVAALPPGPPTGDVRAVDLDGRSLTPEQQTRLRGSACARCGSRTGLRPGGWAYALMRGGRYGYQVRVCGSCPTWGAS